MKSHRLYPSPATGIAGCVTLLLLLAGCARPEPGTFASPEDAVQALNSLIGSGDDRRIEEMFGPGSVDMFRSGDDADDRAAGERVKSMIAERVAFDDFDADTKVVLFGKKEWPFPIPLVRQGERWRFDTAKGREELLNRRVGFNEMWTLTSLHEYVESQREYAAEGRDGHSRAFAQRIQSSEGKHDGLYWPNSEGEPPSPLGDVFASASAAEAQAGEPFHGYFYRILIAQGASAPGGAMSYVNPRGLMTGGFAAIAWPAKYGNSGVMTFVINQRGLVYEKDLGAETESAAAAIQSFDPDSSWQLTGDVVEGEDAAEGEEAAEGGEAAEEGEAAEGVGESEPKGEG